MSQAENSPARSSLSPSATPAAEPRRASVADMERGLAVYSRRDTSSASAASPSTASTASRRRTLVADAKGKPKEKKPAKRQPDDPAAPPAEPPLPPQSVERESRAETAEAESDVVNPGRTSVLHGVEQRGTVTLVKKNANPAILAALAGGPLPPGPQPQPSVAEKKPVEAPKEPKKKKRKVGSKKEAAVAAAVVPVAAAGPPPPLQQSASSPPTSPQQPTLLSPQSQPRSLWQRARGLVFGKEEFTDFGSGLGVDGTQTSIAGWKKRYAAALDRLPLLPSWTKRELYDVADFFTRARVFLVLFIVLVAFLVAAAPAATDAWEAVSGTFVVASDDRPGLTFLEKYNGGNRTLPKKHPVVIVPGFITGALELWDAKGSCLDRQSTSFSGSFRQRMFGPQMIFLLLTDPECWLELFSVNKTSGLDKEHVKVRADSGFASVDYFMPGYWVWAKVLINLADIGYDPQSMAVMTYDWRLSPAMAHARDGFFYQMRNSIKFLYEKNEERAVVISHSYGTTVALAFFKWAETREPGFMNKHVAYYVNVGGTTLGIPKAASALLQGDVSDTLSIPKPARRVFDSFMSQSARYNCTRTWSCLYAMVPHGCAEATPNLVTFSNGTGLDMNGFMELAIAECRRTGHTDCVRQLLEAQEELEELPVLPQAPDTTAICLYGVNNPAEAGYRLVDMPSTGTPDDVDPVREVPITLSPSARDTTQQQQPQQQRASSAGRRAEVAVEEDASYDEECDSEDEYEYEWESDSGSTEPIVFEQTTKKEPQQQQQPTAVAAPEADKKDSASLFSTYLFSSNDLSDSPVRTNTSFSDETSNHGVRMANGDGTVTLTSLAYMCRAANGWKKNTGRVVTVEYPHDTVTANPLNLRGDSVSGGHVDILGNYEFLETILKIASGMDEVGAQPGMDTVEWAGEADRHSSRQRKNTSRSWIGRGRRQYTTLHRRVTDRVTSNIDELIRTEMASCLAKPNRPIKPRSTSQTKDKTD